MAIKTVSLIQYAHPGEIRAVKSNPIPKRHRPIAVILSTQSPWVNSEWTVFLTKSPTPVLEPQPGDPNAFFIRDISANAHEVVISLFSQETIVEANVSLNFVYFNNYTSPHYTRVTYLYEEVD